MTIRSTRTAEWTCGDLTACLTIARPSAREVIEYQGAVARIESTVDAIALALKLCGQLLTDVQWAQRGDGERERITPAELLDAITADEALSLVGWISAPPDPTSAA